MQPDATDWKIIEILRRGHETNSSIAEKIGVVEGTVRQRIKKLKESTGPEDVEQVAYDRWLRAGGRDKRMLRRALKMDVEI